MMHIYSIDESEYKDEQERLKEVSNYLIKLEGGKCVFKAGALTDTTYYYNTIESAKRRSLYRKVWTQFKR